MSATLASWEYSAGSSGESLRPCPRRSQVITGRSADSAPMLGRHICDDAAKPWLRSTGRFPFWPPATS